MTLQEALPGADYSRSPLARDMKTCEAAWNWFRDSVISGELETGKYFLVSTENFPDFCHEALSHSLIKLPHRDSQRYGNLTSELLVAADALKDKISAKSIATLLLSYCGEEEPGRFIQSLSLLLARNE